MFERFFKSEAASGLLLMAVTAMALAVANSPLAPLYFDSLHAALGGLSLLHWINDGLMALFFLLVGLEIRRELDTGRAFHLAAPHPAGPGGAGRYGCPGADLCPVQ